MLAQGQGPPQGPQQPQSSQPPQPSVPPLPLFGSNGSDAASPAAFASSLSDAEARFSAAKQRLLSLIRNSSTTAVPGAAGAPPGPADGAAPLQVPPPEASQLQPQPPQPLPSQSQSQPQPLQEPSLAGLESFSYAEAQSFRGGQSARLTRGASGAEMRHLVASLPLLQPVNPRSLSGFVAGGNGGAGGSGAGGRRESSSGPSVAGGGGSGAGTARAAPRARSVTNAGAAAGPSVPLVNLAPHVARARALGIGASSKKDFDLRLGPAYQVGRSP